VLRQAAILAVLAFTAIHVTAVVLLVVADRRLTCAAETAAAASAVPHASLNSVHERAMGVLDRALEVPGTTMSINIYRGDLRKGSGRLSSGDRVQITFVASSRDALPPVLRRLAPWLASERLSVAARVTVP
jgi:hypothetical protein